MRRDGGSQDRWGEGQAGPTGEGQGRAKTGLQTCCEGSVGVGSPGDHTPRVRSLARVRVGIRSQAGLISHRYQFAIAGFLHMPHSMRGTQHGRHRPPCTPIAARMAWHLPVHEAVVGIEQHAAHVANLKALRALDGAQGARGNGQGVKGKVKGSRVRSRGREYDASRPTQVAGSM